MIKFRKMHGIGNDFVMLDCITNAPPEIDESELAVAMCDRKFGVGSDGLIYIERADGDRFRMRMFNTDGSESEMCGNGIRCFARYLLDEGIVKSGPITVETGAGLIRLEESAGGQIKVDMGEARLTRGEIGMSGQGDETFVSQEIEAGGQVFNGTAVSMGNPHIVLIVPDTEAIDLGHLGPVFEHHELFPDRVNTHFVSVNDREHITMRTWERGSGATLACGTGACAALVATQLNGLTERKARVDLPGGTVTIEYREDGHVMKTGPAETVFDGVWNL